MTQDDPESDLLALVAEITRDRSGLNHVEASFDGCTLRTRNTWSHAPLVVDTQLPLDLVAGPADWRDKHSPPPVVDKVMVTLPLRAERATALSADIAAWQAAYDRARCELGKVYPEILDGLPNMPGSGAHMTDWMPMAETILADFDGRPAGRFLSVLRDDIGDGLQVVDVRMNAPPTFFIDNQTRNELARLISRFQQARCPL